MGGGWWVDVGGLEIGCGGTAAAQMSGTLTREEMAAVDGRAVRCMGDVGVVGESTY